MKITNENILKVAKRYGLSASRSEKKEDAGFYIGDQKLELEDIFPEFSEIVKTDNSNDI